jgi:hypothetical protein
MDGYLAMFRSKSVMAPPSVHITSSRKGAIALIPRAVERLYGFLQEFCSNSQRADGETPGHG